MDLEEKSFRTKIRKILSEAVKAEKGSSEYDKLHRLLENELEGTTSIQLGPLDVQGGDFLSNEEVTALVEVLQEADVSKLEKLDLSHNPIADRDFVALSKILETGRFSRLTYLDLSKPSCNVEMESSKAIAAALKTGFLNGLLHLSLPPCHVPTIAEAMRVGGISNLDHLHLAGHRQLEQGRKEVKNLVETGMLSKVVHLTLWNCSLEADAMEALAQAIESNAVCNLKDLDLSWNPIRKGSEAIARLLRLGYLSGLEFLSLCKCEILDEGMRVISEAIVEGKPLGIQVLNVDENTIRNTGIAELLNALRSGNLPELHTLKISMNWIQEPGMLALAEFLENYVGRLKELHLLELNVSERSHRAFLSAYAKNEYLTVELKNFRWPNRSFETNAERCRRHNVAVTSARNNLKDEKDVPATAGKVFLCGFQKVGKTTLRKSLQRTRFEDVFIRSTETEDRTRGIEVSHIVKRGTTGKSKAVLAIWDLAGQTEYRVLQSAFCLAEGKATIFVIVCNAIYQEPKSEKELLFWLRFVASSCEQGIQRPVLVVLNCFDGHECTREGLWKVLIQKQKDRFKDVLHIHKDPFVLDARKRKSVGELKHHLLTQSQTLLQNLYMPGICQYISKHLHKWKKKNRSFPVVPEEELLTKFQTMGSEKDKEKLLAALRFLHEAGSVVIFSKDMLKIDDSVVSVSGLVVLDPNWFCQRVVGQLLLPDSFLKEGQTSVKSIAEADGSILLEKLHACLKLVLGSHEQVKWVVAMLISLGLCYQAGRDKVLVPAFIEEDDMDKWERCGIKDETAAQWVMGRSLTLMDRETTCLPAALFRRLQVILAQDPKFGADSYTASKSSSTFKYERMIVLIQFDVNENDPEDERIDILVKPLGLITDDPASVRKHQLDLIEDIMDKLEPISICCCPGVQFHRKAIIPWNAAKPTPCMKDRELVSLEEVKERVQQHGLGLDINRCVDRSFVLFDDLLSANDLEGLEKTIMRRYKRLEEDAFFLHIDLNDSDDTQDEIREGFVEELPSGVLTPQCSYIVDKIQNMGLLLRDEVRLQGRLTRKHVDRRVAELQGSIRHIFDKQNSILRKVQAFQSYSVAEKERSLPRFLYLAESSDSGSWITVKKAFFTPFRIHFLCEARVDDGYMHQVQGQEGVTINAYRKWLLKLQPWLEWSLAIAIIVARIVGITALPGLGLLLPNMSCTEGTAIASLVEPVASLGETVVNYPGSSLQHPVHLKERVAAAALLKDLIQEVGWVEFRQKIGLSKAVLKDEHGTPAKCAWICEACFNTYDKRGVLAADITP